MTKIPKPPLGWCGWFLNGDDAQGTVEYALTVVAFLSLVTTLALLWRAGERGTLAALVEKAASHGFDALGALDIALY